MFPFTYQSTSCEHFDMLSSNLESTSSQIISPAFRHHPREQQHVNPRHPHIQCPPLSVVSFLKNNSLTHMYRFVFVHFVKDSHYAIFRKSGQVFLWKLFNFRQKTYLTLTRANFRLPTCATTVAPFATVNMRSTTFSPSSFTPPCSIMRTASALLDVSPACFNN